MSDKKPVIQTMREFHTLTGFTMKFEVMKDGVIGIIVDTDSAPCLKKNIPSIKRMGLLFFQRQGYRYEIADLKEYKKRNTLSEINCDFGVYGTLF